MDLMQLNWHIVLSSKLLKYAYVLISLMVVINIT